MIQRLYLRLFDRFSSRPAGPLIALALLVAGSLAGLSELRVDMSFRPLFADGATEAAETREFEAVFGQASSAYIGVVIERSDVLSAGFVRGLSGLSATVESIDGVTEVVSLPRLAVPVWGGGDARGALVIPPAALENAPPEVDQRIAEIAGRPGVQRVLVSEDGQKTLLLARLALPLDELAGRRHLIREFKTVVAEALGGSAELRFVGVSVVEAAYARIVLESLARSFALTTLALLAVLWLVFRRVAAVAAVTTGVGLAIPVTIGLLALFGQDLTMVNSMVPVMILIIGVADGIHMIQSFSARVRAGEDQREAIRGMFGDMALPCLLTTATTALGFIALRVAEITAIRDFGLNVAIGVVVAYLINLVVIPTVLALVPPARVVAPTRPHMLRGWSRSIALVTRRPGWIAAAAALSITAAAAVVPGLRIDQRFNEEVEPGHPIRADQALLEQEFSGFLGPDVSVVRLDGSTLLTGESLRRIEAYVGEIRKTPGVLRVESLLDLLPAEVAEGEIAAGLRQLRADPLLGSRVRELVDASGSRAAIMVRTEDIGTRRANQLGLELNRLAEAHLGPHYEARLVGQWWLAQRGMDHITRDMLAGFTTSCLLVLPLLALALRRARLVAIAVLPNVLPMLFALAFMAWAGISLRIGTAMVLAIALGITIDDTIHLLVRLKEEAAKHSDPEAAVRAALTGVGGALVYTTVVLVLGFLSMLSNDLLAIRDMGLVAAVTLTVALLADLYLAPALFLLTSRWVSIAADAPAPALSAAELR